MAQITEIKVNYGITANMGNFESLRVDVELSAKLGNDEDANAATDELYETAKSKVNQFIVEKKEKAEEDLY